MHQFSSRFCLALASCAGTKPTAVATSPAATPVAAAPAGPKGVGLDMADIDRTVNPWRRKCFFIHHR